MKYGNEYKMRHLLRDSIVIVVAGFFVSGAIGLAFADQPENRPPENRPPAKTAGPVIAAAAAAAISASEGGSASSIAKGGDAVIGDTTSLSEGGSAIIGDTTSLSEGGNAVNGDISLTGGSTRIERGVSDAYLNYSFNGDACIRTLGLQYGNRNGVGSLGIPLRRDRSCDAWLAVNEAQENGHVLLSYAFMCEVKNIRDIWGLEKCNEIVGLADDWMNTVLGVPAQGK